MERMKGFSRCVLGLFLLVSCGIAWADDGVGEAGGDGECDGTQCRTGGGGRGDDGRSNLPTWTFEPNSDDTLPSVLDAIEVGFEDIIDEQLAPCQDYPCFDSVAATFPSANTRTFDAEAFSEAFCFKEEGDALNKVGVTHPGDGMYAKIRKVTQPAHGGSIYVGLNYLSISSEFIQITTQNGQLAGTVNNAIKTAIENAGYHVTAYSNYFVIDHPQDEMHQVSFESTDPNITKGEVALQIDAGDSTVCPIFN